MASYENSSESRGVQCELSKDCELSLVRALEDARRERRRATAMVLVSKAVQEADNNMEWLVSRLLTVAREVLGCEQVTMFFVDDARNVLVAANALSTDVPTDIVVQMGKGIAGTVALEKIMINVTNAYTDLRFDESTDKNTGFVTRSILCAPVVSSPPRKEGRCIAVIEALNKDGGPFDAEDEFVLETISNELRRPLRRAALDHAFRGACRRASEDNDLSILTMLFDQKEHYADDIIIPEPAFSDNTQEEEDDDLQSCCFFPPAAAAAPHSSVESARKNCSKKNSPLTTFAWDVLSVESESVLMASIVSMLKKDDTLEIHRVDAERLETFLLKIRSSYHSANAYHNFEHGVCVLHAAFVVNGLSQLYRRILGPLDVFALKLAALAHDVDHPGFNNDFEIKTQSRKALLYNDVSVLENHHASFLFATLRRPDCDVLANLDRPQYFDLRRTIVKAILATDMEKHSDHVQALRDASPEALLAPFLPPASGVPPHTNHRQQQAAKSRQFLVNVAVHLGDLINATHPDFDVAKTWGFRIVAEFQAQAKLEAHLGLPLSPTMTRLETTDDIAHAQIGFVDYVVKPLVCAAADLLPELRPLEDNLTANRQNWTSLLLNNNSPSCS